MKAVTVNVAGGPEVLRFEDVPRPEPGKREVLVKVHACGVNRLDFDIREGTSRHALRYPLILGREAVGEVEALGDGCESALLGSRVMVRAHFVCGSCPTCLGGRDNFCSQARLPGIDLPGGYAEYMVAPENSLIPLPADLPYVQAAAVQIAFATAWHAVVTLASVAQGDVVLVTGAAGGVGTAMVQVATLRGATVIAAVGSEAKAAAMLKLGAVSSICYQDQSWAARVMDQTKGRGVDIAVDTVGGEVFEQSIETLGPGGRVVVVGAHAGEVVRLDLVRLFRLEAKVIGSHRATLSDVKAILPLVASGQLTPTVFETRPLSAAATVHADMGRRLGVGKWVLQPDAVLS